MGRIFTLDASRDVDLVGGAASYLALLARAKMPIVDGFVIPMGVALENGLSNEIMRNFQRLNCDSVVLRTSPYSHELDGEILRDVRGEALIDAVRYLQRNVVRRGRRAAIIVQKHLNAEISGVAHSITPVTDSETEILIESSLWMNDTVLGGINEPTFVLVNKRTGAMIHESDEEAETYLDAHLVEQIYTLLRRVEQHSAIPISMDWALDNGHLYILRVRPINQKTKERYQSCQL